MKRLIWVGVIFLWSCSSTDVKYDELLLTSAEYRAFDSLIGSINWALNTAEGSSIMLYPVAQTIGKRVSAVAAPCPKVVGECSGKSRSIFFDTNGDGDGDDQCSLAGRNLFGGIIINYPIAGFSCPKEGYSALDHLDNVIKPSMEGLKIMELTTSNFKRVNKNGSYIKVHSGDFEAQATWDGKTVGNSGLQGATYHYLTTEDDKPLFGAMIQRLRRYYYDSSDALIEDVTVKTSNILNVTGALNKTDAAFDLTDQRTVTGGEVTVWLNTIRATGTVSFSETSAILWNGSECCYPTQGKIAMTFTGSITGIATLDLLGICGAAELTTIDGSRMDVQLVACE